MIRPSLRIEFIGDIFYHLAHGINVGTRIYTAARLLFGSGKGIRHARRRGMAVCVAQSEVDDSHVPIDRREHHVSRFDVHVHHLTGVHLLQSLQQL